MLFWDFGEQGIPQIKDKDVVEHKYTNAGLYTITLIAHGKGTAGKWTQTISVSAPESVSNPFEVTVVAWAKENRVVQTKSIPISMTKDNHPSTFSDHSQTYSETFKADPGFKIIETIFQQSSAARAGDITNRIFPDGSQIQFSYKLTSGPAVDRYRGWLRGNLILKQKQMEPAHDVTLGAEIKISKYGTYALSKSVTIDSIKKRTYSG